MQWVADGVISPEAEERNPAKDGSACVREQLVSDVRQVTTALATAGGTDNQHPLVMPVERRDALKAVQ
jgi:hypothetical protein